MQQVRLKGNSYLPKASEEPEDVEGIEAEIDDGSIFAFYLVRSEERRVGKECRSRWSPYH